jgi:hypothetical protein
MQLLTVSCPDGNTKSIDLLQRKISSFLWPVKDDLGLELQVFIAYPVSVTRCTVDKLVIL